MKLASRLWLAGAIAIGAIVFAATTDSSAQTQTYLDPVTGRDCVQETRAPTSDGYGYTTYHFHNSCGRRFWITIYAGGQALGGTGIAEYGDDTVTVADSRVQGRNVTWSFR